MTAILMVTVGFCHRLLSSLFAVLIYFRLRNILGLYSWSQMALFIGIDHGSRRDGVGIWSGFQYWGSYVLSG
ncbi:hypothetical protein BofuT4_uP091000.1 [Botrytis cinerea T4]|uniref:Uncharacterized protein n=1 Tax=Botryotinia fuckeliana (strain T4) TaxID=999810 RepID=G2YF20_BOTF4|nr:hypothetical protein BofuT4_uP091000.1 [Botrytis cinerea T4]